MKKIFLIILLLPALAIMQGCAIKRGVGIVNNALTLRADYGSFKTELSASVEVDNDFSDSETMLTKFYQKQENGGVLASAAMGLGAYYKLYSGDIFEVSAGLKFYDYISYNYSYVYYYMKTDIDEAYDYTENIRIDYFSTNKVSVIFPDVEIKLPFSDNIRLAVNMELVYLKWFNDGGCYKSVYEERLGKYEGYTVPQDSYCYLSPGKVTGVEVGSGLFYLGTINLGILYYF